MSESVLSIRSPGAIPYGLVFMKFLNQELNAVPGTESGLRIWKLGQCFLYFGALSVTRALC